MQFFKNHRLKGHTLPLGNIELTAANGKPLRTLKRQYFFTIQLNNISTSHSFIIVEELTWPIIIGADFLRECKGNINFETMKLGLKIGDQRDQINICHQAPSTNISVANLEQEKWEIEQEIKQWTSPLLSQNQIKATQCQLLDAKNIFSSSPGCIDTYQHKVEVNDDQGFRKRVYPIPKKVEAAVQEKLTEMLSQGIIRRGISRFISPLVVVKKANGEIRLCLDARQINLLIHKCGEAPLTLDEIFQKFQRAKFLSTIDLTASFNQVKLQPESQQYCSFQFKQETYCYTRVPFGLKCSGPALQRALSRVIPEEIQGNIIVYIDDIYIATSTFQEHLEVLKSLFEAFAKHGVTVNFKKTILFKETVEFLGHTITRDGVKTSQDKIETIQNFQRPTDRKKLMSFLGFLQFYGRFSPRISHIAKPLRELTSIKSKFKWSDHCEAAFNQLKEEFKEQIILYHPDFSKPFYLFTDASDVALGAKLAQKNDDGLYQPVQFASRALRQAELNYSVYEKELFGLFWACKKFYQYIAEQQFTIFTDNKALTSFHKMKCPNQRIIRWMLFLQGLNFDIVHIPGKENVPADYLSRNNPEAQTSPQLFNICLAVRPNFEALQQIPDQQQRDENLGTIYGQISNGDLEFENYKIDNGQLYFKDKGQWKLAIPNTLLDEFICQVHIYYNHIGINKTMKICRQNFYHPELTKRTTYLISSCHTCQTSKIQNKSYLNPIQPIPARQKGEIVSLDVMGKLPMSTGQHRYILVVIDNFTKLIRLFPLRKNNAVNIIRAMELYIQQEGQPNLLVCDRGTQFTSGMWEQYTSDKSLAYKLVPIRHHEGNITERAIRTVEDQLRCYLKDQPHKTWYNYLQDIENNLNQVPHDTTEATPMWAHQGRQPSRPWENILHLKNTTTIPQQKIRENITRNRHRKLRKTNNSRKFTSLNVGDLVLIDQTTISDASKKVMAKLLPRREGPWVISQRCGRNSYELSDVNTGRIRGIFHINQLYKYTNPRHELLT
uniref:RNA-directed DNA polymerase n=4 Tax=Lygus hesperus TaxID=30085 RepID=A0A146LDL4_LYGHE